MTTKFLLVLKICKSAANATVFLISGNPYLSKDVTETFTQRGRHKSKNGKCVVVSVAQFWGKMVTTPVGYFLLVALY